MTFSVFTGLTPQAPDSLLSLIGLYRRDPRPEKIDLGVGVFRDNLGATPVLAAVKAAEQALLNTQATKSYLGPEGDIGFLDLLKPVIFGDQVSHEVFGVQTPGGTGAIRLACELLKAAKPDLRVFIGAPTWPNHTQILDQLGIETVTFRHYDQRAQRLGFDEMMSVLETARAGDAVLLHGCCHNPSGADYSLDQWRAIAELVARKGLTPLIDLAYQGLGLGLEADAAGGRLVLAAADDGLLAYSCDKNFGLYRERVGALYTLSRDAETLDLAASNIRALARTNWSMPPDHGAATVRVILESEALTAIWKSELDAMRRRVADLRQRLATAVPALAPLAGQHGLFGLLPLSSAQVARLREEHGIYMAGSGRINLAGLTVGNIDTFARAFEACLQGEPA
ncbi:MULTISPECIES: amino acid aminotransferase [unclassified Caulobacter]|jgi:aromatic-amino-acid transaminase|uniref:amino acid aminotransferase n=1 Tax=unclassified Caulobacter TaxID=2648921 RepID=UPI000701AF1B|nr:MULTISPECIES: amino acid aminotransferase [unclassified Caulobacter]KQV56561.1 aromatic amino acid aminotransferase [Caulobacter sp. Root342]KQV72196.1 aromatic amino acid aminotransferase [Caulobacter sp. Root343]